jgi:hypothetical protein
LTAGTVSASLINALLQLLRYDDTDDINSFDGGSMEVAGPEGTCRTETGAQQERGLAQCLTIDPHPRLGRRAHLHTDSKYISFTFFAWQRIILEQLTESSFVSYFALSVRVAMPVSEGDGPTSMNRSKTNTEKSGSCVWIHRTGDANW